MTIATDPTRDLVLERTVDVPPAFVWDAWTRPELLKKWFTPQPWETVDAEVDLRPGGVFRTVLRGPGGPEIENAGCWLEVVPTSRLVWTGALGPGYRPQIHGAGVPFVVTAILEFEPTPSGGTRYRATVLHGSAEARGRHEAMGFHHGWSAALDQLVALAAR